LRHGASAGIATGLSYLKGERLVAAQGEVMNRPKTAIVTGGAQGIGKATARRLLAKGMNVVIADADEEAGAETAAEYQRLGPIRFIACDVSQETRVCNLMDEAVKAFGGIELLVNNAGISRFKSLDEASLADWNAVIGVNLTGCFLCSKYAAFQLRLARGAIVNIASTRALMSEPHGEAYAASKGGIVALSHALAVSLGPQVRVNCICPGWIEVGEWQKRGRRTTPHHSERDRLQHPAGRVGVPEDVAAMVDYLVSDEAGFITGANFVVDGGMTRRMIYAE
jgi:NAD(P)-dependent dehydrogenase (short-subunit alcohol dehydrogenase family)